MEERKRSAFDMLKGAAADGSSKARRKSGSQSTQVSARRTGGAVSSYAECPLCKKSVPRTLIEAHAEGAHVPSIGQEK